MSWPIVITYSALRQQLGQRGTDAYLNRLIPRNAPDPESARNEVMAEAISEAQSLVEMNTGTFLTQRIVKTHPITAGLVEGTDYDIEDDGYDFWREDWIANAKITLRHRPVQSIQSVSVAYGQDPASTQTIVTFPEQWVMLAKRTGELNIVPLLSANISTSGALLLMAVNGSVGGWNREIPLAVKVDYTAGILPRNYDANAAGAAGDRVTQSRSYDVRSLCLAVQLRAAALVLSKYELAIAPGGGSVQSNGHSQSFQMGRFDSIIQKHEKQADMIEQNWLALHGGAAMMVF